MRHCETLVSVWVQSLSDEKCRNTWNTQNTHTTNIIYIHQQNGPDSTGNNQQEFDTKNILKHIYENILANHPGWWWADDLLCTLDNGNIKIINSIEYWQAKYLSIWWSPAVRGSTDVQFSANYPLRCDEQCEICWKEVCHHLLAS